ncbi:hypothetical protein GEMRC1_004148 [Eukaryota sp. GEM-RC1]
MTISDVDCEIIICISLSTINKWDFMVVEVEVEDSHQEEVLGQAVEVLDQAVEGLASLVVDPVFDLMALEVAGMEVLITALAIGEALDSIHLLGSVHLQSGTGVLRPTIAAAVLRLSSLFFLSLD